MGKFIAKDFEQKQNSSYELQYGNTHGGPYAGIDVAIDGAVRLLRSGCVKNVRIFDREVASPGSVEFGGDLYADLIVSRDRDVIRLDGGNPDLRPFKTCKPGDWVLHGGDAYLVASQCLVHHAGFLYVNCVRLKDGEVNYIEPNAHIVRTLIGGNKS